MGKNEEGIFGAVFKIQALSTLATVLVLPRFLLGRKACKPAFSTCEEEPPSLHERHKQCEQKDPWTTEQPASAAGGSTAEAWGSDQDSRDRDCEDTDISSQL